MLEVKNLVKEYRNKKGVATKALDGVSLNFSETGMVFILGKSGSGKSTLLNICGGLDRMDLGEIIIKGKSSKDFSAQDFDSYRNTFVGFVFQEYNILDEFTVEQNIALALELQNKKADKAAIEKLLADVDMTEFATRKPNTLSGGQKQRVAIARALVKEPEIIMADEPTGALDSKTGQQVFDTLKKLSENKLVIVISHDRDFAERYGDRIIELKDGRIISDCIRSLDRSQNNNVSFYGNDTVCVNDGAALTDADLASIKEFLAKSGGAAVISTSRDRIAQFKEDRPEINVGTFEDIEVQPIPKQYEPQKLIRSHLPVRHAVKMGASSLKTKPIRLIFTILLSLVAFVLFGLASTLMLFDGHDVTVQTFVDSGINYITLGKVYQETYYYDDGDSYSYDNDTPFSEDDYKALANKYDGAIPSISYDYNIDNVSMSSSVSQFYSSRVNGVVEASDALELVAGRLPESDDEIAITDFMYDGFGAGGTKFVYGENNITLFINSYSDILYSDEKPVTLRFGNEEYKIVGIFKGMTVPADYRSLKEAADSNEQPSAGSFGVYTWSEERDNGLYSRVAVTPAVFEEAMKENVPSEATDISGYFRRSADSIRMNIDATAADNLGYYYNSFAKYEGKTLPVYGTDGDILASVGNGEIAIVYNMLAKHYYDVYNKANVEIDSELIMSLNNMRFSDVPFDEAHGTLTAIAQAFKEMGVNTGTYISNRVSAKKEVEIVGYFYAPSGIDCCYLGADLYDEFYVYYDDGSGSKPITKYEIPATACIDYVYVPYDGSTERIEQLITLSETREKDDSAVVIQNTVYSRIQSVVEIADTMEMYFIIIGAVLAVFAFLLMFNFISASITAKKKEIGILRAIGARTTDVFKIFISEAFIIAAICFVLSALGTLGVCILLNSMLATDVGLGVSLFVFGPLPILCVFGVAFITAIVSTVIPVAIYSRKPPIASIRSL